jgi:hypothetical protein
MDVFKLSNFKLWRFAGGLVFGVAVGFAAWLLFNPYTTETVKRTIQVGDTPTEVEITRDVIAWSSDAAVGAAIPLGILVIFSVICLVASKKTSFWQDVATILVAIIVGAAAWQWASDILNDEANFNASAAWRGALSAVSVVGALLFSHLFYQHFTMVSGPAVVTARATHAVSPVSAAP